MPRRAAPERSCTFGLLHTQYLGVQQAGDGLGRNRKLPTLQTHQGDRATYIGRDQAALHDRRAAKAGSADTPKPAATIALIDASCSTW